MPFRVKPARPDLWPLIFVLFLTAALSSCSPQKSPTPSEPTKEPQPTTAPLVTSTRNPAKAATPTNTSTPTISPTTIPETRWSTEIPQPIQIQNFTGSWSPVSNSIGGVLRHDHLTTGTLALAAAPAFSTTILDSEHQDRVLPEITFSPDGSQIFYGVSPAPSDVDLVIWISGEMLRLEVGSGKIIPTGFTFLEGLGFWGWMDEHTPVFTSYSGGGHESITAWNYGTGKVVLQDTLPVYSFGDLHFPYAAINGCETNCIAFVMLPYPRPGLRDKPCLITCQSAFFPSQQVTSSHPDSVESFSQDWLPETNQLLVAVRDNGNGDQPKAGLVLWDVEE